MALSLDGTTGISASGNITGGNVIASGSLVVGSFAPASVSTAGNVTGGNILTGGLISATSNITGGNISATNHTGTTVSVTGNITGAYLFGNASTVTGLSASKIFNGTSEANIGTSGGNANITIAGTSNVLVVASTGIFTTGLSSVTGNITGGNISATNHTGTAVSVTGAVTGASVVGGVMTGTSISVTGAVSGASTSVSGTVTGASVVGGVMTGTSLSVSGNINGGNLIVTGIVVDNIGNLDLQTTATNGNINLITNGTGNVTTSANIMPTANATANIGSATLSFNTIFAKATSAQYADLAEMYCADSEYTPGTVLDFGGTEEVTITTQSHSTQVAGIVSTNPSYLMNSTLDCTNALAVALVGRVPCYVVGTIAKGDRLVASSTPGIATRLDMSQYQPGCIIGKALESYDLDTVGTIEVAVGRI
jgi:hypothetical protein